MWLEVLLTLAITTPTFGCRQYADRLADQGFVISKSTVQNQLVAHGLGRRQWENPNGSSSTAISVTSPVVSAVIAAARARRWWVKPAIR